MKLTASQLDIIREATTDQAAYERVLNALETPPPDESPSPDKLTLHDDFELIAQAIEGLPVSFFVKDRESRFVMSNRENRELVQRHHSHDIIGKTDFDFLSPEKAQRYYEAEQELMRTGEPLLNQINYVTEAYGGPFWLLSSKQPVYNNDGDIIGLVGINLDITRLKQVEQVLEKERNLLLTLINSVNDHIYVKDTDGHFVLVNDSILNALDIDSQDEIIGKTDFDYMPSGIAQRFRESERKIIETGQPIIDWELPYQSPTSSEPDQWWLITKVPIYDEDDNISGIVGMNRNITQHKHSQRREVELELQRKRSEILNEFLSGSSHEFRTPIATINSSLYLLSKTDDPDKREQYIQRIGKQTDQLTHLIDVLNQIMEFDRGINLYAEWFSVGPFLKSILQKYQDQIEEKHLNVALNIASSVSDLYGDQVMLQRALSILIDNAICYSSDKDEVTVQVSADNEQTFITVKDTGIGMTTETLEHIFERFYRADTNRSTDGFGLGLAIVHGIVDLHNGTITAKSQIDVGSEFTVVLPHPKPNTSRLCD